MVIGYHYSDIYANPDASTRISHYGVTGYPTTWFDGTVRAVGGQTYGTNYAWFRGIVNDRLRQETVIDISLECTYDTVTRTGSVTATVQNSAVSSQSGTLHFAIVENDIPHNWSGGMHEVDYCMRDMLPDGNGEAVVIPASDTIMRSRDYSLDALWVEGNCKIVVFLQSASDEIYQGAEIAVLQNPHMEYYGLAMNETAGNGNGIAEPGETIEFRIAAKNINDGEYTGTATVQTSDPNISIQSSTPQTVSIGPGEIDTVFHLGFDIDNNCPDPHETTFEIDFGSSVDTIPFVIASCAGFGDDMESGEGDWTHGGTFSLWHLTENRYNSPTHSWYCGNTGGVYPNQCDASLYSPYFVATPDSNFSFYHWYSTEANYDYVYAEVDNGSGWWRTLGDYTGASGSWFRTAFSMSEYNGQTIRVRFRIVADYNASAEGWYIDDVMYPSNLGVAEEGDLNNGAIMSVLTVHPNPFSKLTQISFDVDSRQKSVASVQIYDCSGRLVKQYSYPTIQQSNNVVWDGTDNHGVTMPAGIYFVVLETGSDETFEKVILVR